MNRETQLILRRIAGVILPAAALGLLINGSVLAQEGSSSVFEEIVVTAQKRSQNIMDVPIAISAVTGQQIDDAGIKDVFDLQQNVASLTITRSQTATTTGFSIRGIGSTSNNFGVESSVGLYVDGVYRSRQSSLINELIDVEAVEVLRGPQGTLFGKNTPAGAVLVRTVAPGQDTDAFIDVTAGDYGLVRVSGAANIAFNDKWAMRGTIFSSQRDGYIEDVNLGKDLYNDRDRQGVRLQLAYGEPSDDFNMRIIADYAEIDESCCGTVTLVDGIFSQQDIPSWPGIAADPDAFADALGSDAVLGGTPLNGPNPFGGTIFTDTPYPPGLLELIYTGNPAAAQLPDNIVTGSGTDDYVTGYNFAPISKNEDAGLSVEFNKVLGNGMTLTSITAVRSFDTYDEIDLDFTSALLGTRINEADQSSFSQEFRLAGEFGDGGNFVVGAYYFGQEIDQITITDGVTPLIESYLDGSSTFQSIYTAVNGVNAQAGALGYPEAADALPFGFFSQDDILQEQTGWAVFGQVDFPIGENFVVTLGGRYTDEKKDITAAYTQNVPWDPATAPDFSAFALESCRLVNNLYLGGDPDTLEPCDLSVGQFDPFRPGTLETFLPFGVEGWGNFLVQPVSPRPDLDESISDDQFTGNVKLAWFPGESTMLYASFSTGFKSGGTNTERIGAQFSPLFDAETSESFEIGFKGDLGPVRMALTYYYTVFEDFQAQSFTGTGFNLQNAGEIENTGIEAEFLWRPFDNTELQLIYTHNEADYKSFDEGTCWDGYTFHTGIPDPGLPDGFNSFLDLEVCDKAGNPVAYNPEDRLFLAWQQDFNVSTNNTLFFRLEYSHASEQFTDGDLDPFTIQPSYEIVNARVGLNFGKLNSSLTFWGRNITDERYFVGSFDAPVQLGRMNAYPAEPATFGATFRMGFD